MKHDPRRLIVKFRTLLKDLEPSPELYAKRPGLDFSRNRKLPFPRLIELLVSMGGASLSRELRRAFRFDPAYPSPSAFCQQRSKLLPSALPAVLSASLQAFPCKKRFNGYRLIACDGSGVGFPYNASEKDFFVQHSSKFRGSNYLYLTALYDLCEKQYLDANLRPGTSPDEYLSFNTLIDRFPPDDKTIFVADRGFESFNTFAHLIEKGFFFLIRVKSPDSNKILRGCKLPVNCSFDRSFHLILTRKKHALYRDHPETYRIICANHRFDFWDRYPDGMYPLSFRAVAVPLKHGEYEYLITNLDPDRFPPDMLRYIYRLRWGIETSFRHLKYTIGLVNFHSKKAAFVCQEIFARLILFNLCQRVASQLDLSRSTKSHVYVLNFSDTADVFRHLFSLPQDVSPPDTASLLSICLHPLKPDRSFPCQVRPHAAVSLMYRVP